MKDHSSDLIEPSRRGFAKSVAAALVAAPLAAALAGCRQQAPNQENAATHATLTTPPPPSGAYAVSCEGQTVTVTHEPPIIIGSGSFYMEMRDTLTPPSPGGQPPYVYTKTGGPQYYDIHSIRIFTEYPFDPAHPLRISDVTYFPMDPRCELWIWLQKIIPSPSSDCMFDTLSADPDIRISGGDAVAGTTMQVKLSNDSFSPVVSTHKCSNPNRYSHLGTGLGSYFRIGKWRIADAAGNAIHFPAGPGVADGGEAAGDDSYRFYLAFNHPELH